MNLMLKTMQISIPLFSHYSDDDLPVVSMATVVSSSAGRLSVSVVTMGGFVVTGRGGPVKTCIFK